jgi:hypothetical protein
LKDSKWNRLKNGKNKIDWRNLSFLKTILLLPQRCHTFFWLPSPHLLPSRAIMERVHIGPESVVCGGGGGGGGTCTQK